jgi:hypothetical protein
MDEDNEFLRQGIDPHTFHQKSQHLQDFIHGCSPTIENRPFSFNKRLLTGLTPIMLGTICRVPALFNVPC